MGAWCRLGLVAAGVLVGCGSSEHAESQHGGSGGKAATAGGGGKSSGTSGAAGSSTAGSGAMSGNTAGGRGGAGGAGAGGTAGSGKGGDAGTMSTTGGEATGGADARGECPSGTSNHASGTRIKGRWAVTKDGARGWLGWHDSELDQDCQFITLTDGKYHCTPFYSLSDEYYTDDDCTEQAYTRGFADRCAPVNFIWLYDDDCSEPSGGYRFFDLGETIADQTEVYVMGEEGCTATSPPTEALYRIGPETSPDRFVSATYGSLSGTGRIQGYGMSASDGTRQLTEWRDTELETDCRFSPAEDGERRCLPYPYFVSGYSDDTCTTPLATGNWKCDDAAPPYATDNPTSKCPVVRQRVFATGARYEGDIYSIGGDACEVGTSDDRARYLTTPVPPEMFEAVSSSVDEARPGRLKPKLTTSDGGCWLDNLWDSELEVECRFRTASDGVERCLPAPESTPYYTLQTFADDACTVQQPYAGPFDCGATPIEQFVTVSAVTSDDCGYSYTVYRTGDVVTAEELGTLWRKTGTSGTTTCTQVTVAAGNYAPLTLMEPSAFVEAEIVLE